MINYITIIVLNFFDYFYKKRISNFLKKSKLDNIYLSTSSVSCGRHGNTMGIPILAGQYGKTNDSVLQVWSHLTKNVFHTR